MSSENKSELNLSSREIFEQLYHKDLKGKTKDKMGLTYVSWATAWAELKLFDPNATSHVYTRTVTTHEVLTTTEDGYTKTVTNDYENEVLYFTDGKTCHVKVGVTVNGVEQIERLPVMDMRNQAVRVDVVTSTAVNRAIQRCFVKACARHGLGLYIYTGEDFPDGKSAAFVDVKDIRSQAEAITLEKLDETKFNSLKTTVIDLIQTINGGEDVSNAIVDYCRVLFPDTRLSQIVLNEQTNDNLQRLHYFLSTIKTILG